ncbi:YolD-like family protein [Bacillus arachidis]|uniref:YolD-like family protein n=1 Tax=Bacillus arachidis TaxID=2819290 RepID=UPI00255C49E4|nr:YolD-like family protein [Bacillus arachidis]WIY59421.1 YolD-like family protein [Bacillus arachidis]
MLLRKLAKNHLITIDYYQSGFLQTCKGQVCNLDLHQQTLVLINEQQKVFSICLSDIKEIY